MTRYDQIVEMARVGGLLTMGAMHPDAVGAKGVSGGTLVLFGAGAEFWPAYHAASEARDGQPDPIDRWSRRIVGEMAETLGATAHYPFGGPPYAPFIDWARKSGRAFGSPTGMLVHDSVGLMISYRGALHVADCLEIPEPASGSPCDDCADRPCLSACPVGALGATHPYDLGACHGYLDTPAGSDCLDHGCRVRRACPLSAGAARTSAQSAHHMKAFHPS